MNIYVEYIAAALTAFAFAALLSYPVLALVRKLKAGQTVLEYVDKHMEKSGTPTMGGIIFIVAVIAAAAVFGGIDDAFCAVACAVTVSYGLLGFLDDFIKVRYKHNQGLKAYQKIVGQAGIAIIVTVFCYRNAYIGSEIYLPFTTEKLDLGWAFVPFCMFMFIGVTNAVNLTDGLDGLVAKCGGAGFTVTALAALYIYGAVVSEGDVIMLAHVRATGLFCACFAGALFAFVWLNSAPASIFMGDTGSLAVGGGLACATVFLKLPLLDLFIGIMYVVSCISVIVQVLVYKIKGKRVFLMAPFHHHLEYKGMKESKIVARYVLITIVAGMIGLIGFMAQSYE